MAQDLSKHKVMASMSIARGTMSGVNELSSVTEHGQANHSRVVDSHLAYG